MKWTAHDKRLTIEHLGIIPSFISEFDPRPAKEQFNENYAHGGGWRHMDGFKLNEDNSISYGNEKPLPLLASTKLRDEMIRYYDYSWVMILQKDGSFEISRMD